MPISVTVLTQRVKLSNKYCRRMNESGVGDCAGISKKELEEALAESERRVREGNVGGPPLTAADGDE